MEFHHLQASTDGLDGEEVSKMVDVALDIMTEGEFRDFVDYDTIHYAEENVKAGYWLLEGSMDRSKAEFARLLPEGKGTKDNFLLTAYDKDSKTKIGSVWLKVERGETTSMGFIFEILIDEEHRGKGYGTAVMKAVEEKGRRLGLNSLALHVFAANSIALHLYRKSGLSIKNMNMMKSI